MYNTIITFIKNTCTSYIYAHKENTTFIMLLLLITIIYKSRHILSNYNLTPPGFTRSETKVIVMSHVPNHD